MKLSFGKILIAFLILPFVELYLLLQLSANFSALLTFAIVILTGVLGAFLAKNQGQKVLKNIQRELELGRLPGDDMIYGLCILMGGILLLTPGLISDTLGLLLLFPLTRIWFTKYLKRQFSTMVQREAVRIYPYNLDPFTKTQTSGLEKNTGSYESKETMEDIEIIDGD